MWHTRNVVVKREKDERQVMVDRPGSSLTWRCRVVRSTLLVAPQLTLQLADPSLLFSPAHRLVLLGFAAATAVGIAALRSRRLGGCGLFVPTGSVLLHELVELMENIIRQLVDVEFELVVLDALSAQSARRRPPLLKSFRPRSRPSSRAVP